MTLYLTDLTSPKDVTEASQSGVVYGVKLYPAGATTHSDSGVTSIERCHDALASMGELGLPLLVHGESTDPDVDVYDREKRFIESTLAPLADSFPTLRIVFEHVTTADAVQFVGIAIDDAEPVREFADSFGMNYPVLLGDMGAVAMAKRLGNRYDEQVLRTLSKVAPLTPEIRRDLDALEQWTEAFSEALPKPATGRSANGNGAAYSAALERGSDDGEDTPTPTPVERHPTEVQGLLGYEFFTTDRETGRARELDQLFGPEAPFRRAVAGGDRREGWLGHLGDGLVELLGVLADVVPDQQRDVLPALVFD